MFKQYGNKVLIDRESSVNYIYVGTSASGSKEDEPVWQIKKLVMGISGNVSQILYANGDAMINSKWSEREDLEYL